MSKSSSPGLTGCGGNPRRVTLRVKVPRAARWSAERLARSHARRSLEIVLAALVGDMAVAWARSGSWEHERVSAWLTSHVWEIEPSDDQPRVRSEEVLGSEVGNYPWDRWEKHAVEQGVPAELASIGRAVIREAWQHGWDERLCSLCGWRDDGARMLRLALCNPRLAEKRWLRLLATDGGRYEPKTGRVL